MIRSRATIAKMKELETGVSVFEGILNADEIKQLKASIRDLHASKKPLYKEKSEDIRDLKDLAAKRRSAIKKSQENADDSIFGGGVPRSRYKSNLNAKSDAGWEAKELKDRMNRIGRSIDYFDKEIDEINGKIQAKKSRIDDVVKEREKVKKILFTK